MRLCDLVIMLDKRANCFKARIDGNTLILQSDKDTFRLSCGTRPPKELLRLLKLQLFIY